MSNVKFGGGNIMVWGCFSANGIGNVQIIEGKKNVWKYQDVWNSHFQEYVTKLEVSSEYIFNKATVPSTQQSLWKNG